ncbi:hypothetical protein VNO80_27049 [Phaseolus coccineus]|uniref:Uncharacterized protein n=1 Tax=Phaseolus coccineus TaxID=3886 RepID=A0AAN9LJ57_PHACN
MCVEECGSIKAWVFYTGRAKTSSSNIASTIRAKRKQTISPGRGVICCVPSVWLQLQRQYKMIYGSPVDTLMSSAMSLPAAIFTCGRKPDLVVGFTGIAASEVKEGEGLCALWCKSMSLYGGANLEELEANILIVNATKCSIVSQDNLVQIEVVYKGSNKAKGVVKGKLWFRQQTRKAPTSAKCAKVVECYTLCSTSVLL